MSDGSRNRPVRGRALGVLLGWVVTLGLGLLALEGILRLCGLRPIVTINEPDRELGWVKRRDASTRKSTGEYDVTFSINELGLRDDRGLTRAKPAGVRRVLFVGDSFVLGYTVDRQDHFVDLVEDALRADGRDVQALNGGTEGYSTDQEVLWLQKEGLAFEPDVVVACFFQNDVFWNGKQNYTSMAKPRFTRDGVLEPVTGAPPPPRGWFATNTAIGGMFDNLATNSRYGKELTWRRGDTVMPRDEIVVFKEAPLEITEGWARTEACFRKLRETCEQARTKLLLVAIPSREEVEPGALERFAKGSGLSLDEIDPVTPSARALDLARKAGIATLDPKPALQAAARAGGPLYFEKDWHVNPAGSRVLGRAVYEELAKPEFLGGGATPAGLAAFAGGSVGSRPVWPYVVGAIWLLLSVLYSLSYRDEGRVRAFVQVGAMVGAVVAIVLGFGWLIDQLGPRVGRWAGIGIVGALVGYIGWKLLPKLTIIREVYGSFLRRGHWYMIPLLVAMLSIGGLLVVASSSPFIAPFIYTLF